MTRKELKKLKAYTLDQPPHRVKLNQNESPYEIPAPLKQQILGELEKLRWNRYPSPYADRLRQVIGEKEDWDPEGVVVSGGSNILVQLLVLATAIRGKLLTVHPTFSLYEFEGALLKNRVIRVPLDRETFAFQREIFLKALRNGKPDITFLANPNSPTGNLIPEPDLLEVLKKSPGLAPRGLTVIDEAYFPFSGETIRPHLEKFPNLVILRTLSKAFSLGGIRLGYLLADREIATTIRKVMLPFTVSQLQETIGCTVLQNDGYLREVVQKIVDERERLLAALQKIPSVRAYPSATNFILFRVEDAARTYLRLVEQGILIRPMGGHGLKDCLRVSVGTPEENRAFLEALKA